MIRPLALAIFASSASVLVAALATINLTACAGPQEHQTLIAQAQKPPVATSPLLVVYPSDNATIQAASSFFIGAVQPGYTLTINGAPVPVNAKGYFAHVINLERGSNRFVLNALGPNQTTRTYTINREKINKPLAAILSTSNGAEPQIIPSSIEPRVPLVLSGGEIIEFAARATPGGTMHVTLGNKTIPMLQIGQARARSGKAGAQTSINTGLDAAYGKVFQRFPANQTDLYVGIYKIEPQDNFQAAQPRFVLTHPSSPGKPVSHVSAIPITVARQPQVAQTVHDDTIMRVAPDQARLTQQPAGVRLLVDGVKGDNIRVQLGANKHVWFKRDDLAFEQAGAPAPHAVARAVTVLKDDYGETISIPLSQKLPFTIDQQLNPNKLTLKLFGCAADTDWMQQEPLNGASQDKDIIDNIAFKQPEDNVYQLDVSLSGNRQYGFYADYQDDELRLHIKKRPNFENMLICVDPGHGGNEKGSIGCSGMPEKDLNLAIALKLKARLEAAGARVVMTRSDDRDVSLNDRVKIAERQNADLLLSVHNNALPDGRNPMTEHGTSTYWYQPQSQEMARLLKDGMVKGLGLPDLKARYQNLALCRPSKMQAVLLEVGFMVNPDEFAALENPETQEKAAISITNAVKAYYARP